MRFVHLTDPHLSSLKGLPANLLLGKRLSGYLSWTLNRQRIHLRSTLDRLTRAVSAERADQLILSGDLIQIGLESEICEAGNWLAELAPPQKIFFVPGNHDVYAHDSWAAMRRYWREVLPESPEGCAESPSAGYPLTRDVGTVRLIGASSACVTPTFSARGALGQDQLDRLHFQLQEARSSGLMPCLAIHHWPLSGMTSWRKALKEIHATKMVIQQHLPAIVWCGHLHRNVEVMESGAYVFCTASASSSTHSSYRIFDVDPFQHSGRRGWSIHMCLKSISADGTRFAVASEKRWRFTLP